jgi:hypothetical protein
LHKVNVNKTKIILYMFNNQNDYLYDQSKISNYIILISVISILSFFISLRYSNLLIYGQESNSKYKDINITMFNILVFHVL